MLGGVADIGGVGTDDIGEAGLEGLDHGAGVIDAQRGLGDIGQRQIGRQIERLHVGDGGDQMHLGVDLADGALDLWVAGVADQDHGPAVADIALGLGVDLGNQRAGGVEHRQAASGGGLDHRAGHAVGAEDGVCAVGHLVELLDEDGALGLEIIDHMAVVDDLVTHIDRGLVLIERPLDDLDRPDDTGAEAAGLGENHAHE